MKKIDGKTGKGVYSSRKLQHNNLNDSVCKWYQNEQADGIPCKSHRYPACHTKTSNPSWQSGDRHMNS